MPIEFNQPECQLLAFLTRWGIDSLGDIEMPSPSQLKAAAKQGNRSGLLRLAMFLNLHVGEGWSNGRIARLIAWRLSPRREHGCCTHG